MAPTGKASLANGADALTAARLLAAAVVVPLLASADWALAALLVALAWVSDLLDGRMARLSGETTRLGGLDLVADTIFGGAVIVGLVVGGFLPVWLGLSALLVFGALFANGNVAAAMALQLTGFVPLLYELWQQKPVTWWAPFAVALLAATLDWRRLVFINIPAFVRGVTGRTRHL